MTKTEIARFRLRAQGIAPPGTSRPDEAVRAMGALQAQDQPQANWAIGLRTRSGTRDLVEEGMQGAKVVLSWPNRGTLHYVHAGDIRWLLTLLAPRNLARAQRRLDQLGLDRSLFQKAERTIERALRGGLRLGRAELLHRLDKDGVDTSGQRGYHILWYLGQRGVLCFGPREGKSQTFVLLDEWVPAGKQLGTEEALRELASRYFASHGPATRKDFAKWAGITLRDAGLGIDAAASDIQRVNLADRELLYSDHTEAPDPDDFAHGYLLPAFDEYLLGYMDRDDILDPVHADRVAPGGNGMFRPMMVLDGQIVGTWRRRPRRDLLEIELEPFDGCKVDPKMFARAADRFSLFTGTACQVLVP